MATFTITIPDAQLARVVAALCDAAGTTRSGPNARAALAAHIRATVLNVELGRAQSEAMAGAGAGWTDPGVTA